MSGLPLNIDVQQILLHMFNFVILAGGLYFLLYKPVKDFMDKRTEYFRSMEEQAKEKVAEAENLKSTYESHMQRVREEAENERAETMRKAAEESSALIRETKERNAKLLAEAKKQAEAEREKLLSDARSEIAGMVMTATEKTILENSTRTAYDQFLNAAGEEGDKHDEKRKL